jgi:hypothetical protein
MRGSRDEGCLSEGELEWQAADFFSRGRDRLDVLFDRVAFGPASQSRIGGYRIGEDQSGGIRAFAQPASH